MTQDPISFADLAQVAPSSWNLDNVDNFIWVGAGGDPSAKLGSEANPYPTIRDGLTAATPGTAVMVKAGEYREYVDFIADRNKVTERAISGEDDAPILLISADGEGAARIEAPRDAPRPAIEMTQGQDNIGVIGFDVVGHANQFNSRDAGVIKIGTHGLDYENPASNILIAGNRVDGTGTDGIKAYLSEEIYIVGNEIVGSFLQESIDMPGVQGGIVAFNTIAGRAGYTGLTLKAGTRDIEVAYNEVVVAARDGVWVGGRGNIEKLSAEYQSYSASDIYLHDNFIAPSPIEDRREDSRFEYLSIGGVSVLGAADVAIEGNVIAPNPFGLETRVRADISVRDNPDTQDVSRDIEISGNYLSAAGVTANEAAKVEMGQNFVETPAPEASYGASETSQFYSAYAKELISAVAEGRPVFAPIEEEPVQETPVVEETPAPVQPVQPAPPADPNEGLILSGDNGDDSLRGADNADSIYGRGGDDEVRGRAGDDLINGGGGEDFLKGGNGRDKVLGGAGDDFINGGGDGDRIVGGAGDDTLIGGRGRDIIVADDGDDLVIASGEGDLINLTSGADTVRITKFNFGSVQIRGFDTEGEGKDVLDLTVIRKLVASQAEPGSTPVSARTVDEFIIVESTEDTSEIYLRTHNGDDLFHLASLEGDPFEGMSASDMIEADLLIF